MAHDPTVDRWSSNVSDATVDPDSNVLIVILDDPED